MCKLRIKSRLAMCACFPLNSIQIRTHPTTNSTSFICLASIFFPVIQLHLCITIITAASTTFLMVITFYSHHSPSCVQCEMHGGILKSWRARRSVKLENSDKWPRNEVQKDRDREESRDTGAEQHFKNTFHNHVHFFSYIHGGRHNILKQGGGSWGGRHGV